MSLILYWVSYVKIKGLLSMVFIMRMLLIWTFYTNAPWILNFHTVEMNAVRV